MAEVSVSKLIKADAATVWEMVSEWGGTHKWIPGVGPVTVEGDGVGSIRSADLDPATGFPGRISETLDALDEAAMYFRYSIVGESPIPIADYSAEMQVNTINDNETEVVWSSTWVPSGELSEAELLAAFKGLYDISLNNVKEALE